jgi:hypothetical protein
MGMAVGIFRSGLFHSAGLLAKACVSNVCVSCASSLANAVESSLSCRKPLETFIGPRVSPIDDAKDFKSSCVNYIIMMTRLSLV